MHGPTNNEPVSHRPNHQPLNATRPIPITILSKFMKQIIAAVTIAIF